MEKTDQIEEKFLKDSNIEIEEKVPLNQILTVMENRLLDGWSPLSHMVEDGMYTIFFRKSSV